MSGGVCRGLLPSGYHRFPFSAPSFDQDVARAGFDDVKIVTTVSLPHDVRTSFELTPAHGTDELVLLDGRELCELPTESAVVL